MFLKWIYADLYFSAFADKSAFLATATCFLASLSALSASAFALFASIWSSEAFFLLSALAPDLEAMAYEALASFIFLFAIVLALSAVVAESLAF